jgi:tetratricopeptide (TPR) repeat protein
MVLLDYAPSRDAPPPTATGELGRALTDSRGRFQFQVNQVSSNSGTTGLFAVTARCRGYHDAVQILDLTFSPHTTATLDLHRDPSKDQPNVPPGGPGETLIVRHPLSSKAQAELKKGQELLLEKHDPKGSVDSLKKVVKLDPNFAPGFLLLGTAYIQQGEWPEAKSAFENASKLEPANAEAFLGLGVCLNAQQQFNDAQKPLQHSLELNPGSAEAHYELGKSLWAQKKWQEAEPHAFRAIAINKDFPPSHVLMGNIYLRRRDAASALREFKEYLRLDPTGPLAEPVKGMVEKIQRAAGQR